MRLGGVETDTFYNSITPSFHAFTLIVYSCSTYTLSNLNSPSFYFLQYFLYEKCVILQLAEADFLPVLTRPYDKAHKPGIRKLLQPASHPPVSRCRARNLNLFEKSGREPGGHCESENQCLSADKS